MAVAAQRIQEEEERRQIAIKVEDGDDDEEGGLTFDETSEFVQAVGNMPIVEPKVEVEESNISKPAEEPRQLSESRETESEEEAATARANDAALGVGTSSEQTFSSGMASTLNILRQQGILAQHSADQMSREKTQKQRDLWLAEQRRRVTQRELEKQQARGGNKDQAQREYENRLREQMEAREVMDAFKDYKPDVNVVYHDEFGRTLTQKEAWKALSHKFHGKGSGKMKTEKRLKKIADEKKKEAMASGDTPLSMNKAFQLRQEKTGQAHFVLSVGNRGYVFVYPFFLLFATDSYCSVYRAVPQASEFLDAQPLAKGKTEKTKKKKEGKNALNSDAGFMTVPAPQLHLMSNGNESSPGPSASVSPAPKPGFSRISTMADNTPSQEGTPVPGERPKVAFGLGLGTKRKADLDETIETPPSKRR